jgi:hypothetical protein
LSSFRPLVSLEVNIKVKLHTKHMKESLITKSRVSPGDLPMGRRCHSCVQW